MSMSKTVNLLDLQPGMRVTMVDGAIAEVVENPQDGIWVICRYLSHPTNPQISGAGMQPVFAQDIVSLA
jgi:methionine aminopeptidase